MFNALIVGISSMNTRYKIKTDKGYAKFDTVMTKTSTSVKLVFSDNTQLVCSLDHRVLLDGTFVRAATLRPGNMVSGKRLVSTTVVGEQLLYDVVNSETQTYYTNGILSHNCSFLGSSNTLIAGWKLQQLTFTQPIENLSDKHWSVYETPKTNNSYCMTVDVSEGLGQDYAVVSVFDVTAMPYKLVAVYRNNLIQPVYLTEVAYRTGIHYNNAYALIENNSIGKIVADSLFFDFEYENLFRTTSKHGETDIGFGGHQPGIRTTAKTKALGCAQLKSLIESNSLIVEDFNAVSELSTFTVKGKSYAADKGKTDDVVMTLVLFAWFTAQPYFSDMFDVDVRKQLRDTMDIDSNIGFMFIDDGVTDYDGLDTFG